MFLEITFHLIIVRWGFWIRTEIFIKGGKVSIIIRKYPITINISDQRVSYDQILLKMIAYYYTMLSLRHLIVVMDLFCLTSPTPILNKYREIGMGIDASKCLCFIRYWYALEQGLSYSGYFHAFKSCHCLRTLIGYHTISQNKRRVSLYFCLKPLMLQRGHNSSDIWEKNSISSAS
jgi:hypothetical protein